MAERTTRVDRTGGEPIAAKLEWTAARLEPEERMGSARSPERAGHERTPDRSSAMGIERLAPSPPYEEPPGAAEGAGWRHVPARYEAGVVHGGHVERAGRQGQELRREGPPLGWEGPWIPGETRAAYEPVGAREAYEPRGAGSAYEPAGARADYEPVVTRAEIEPARGASVPWAPGIKEQRRWELEGPTPEERAREAERREHARAENREYRQRKKKAESKISTEAKKEALVRDIDANRARLVEVVSELDARRREIMDPRLQFRRHRGAIVTGAIGFLAFVGTTIYLVVRRQQLRQRPVAKARRLRAAMARMIDRPEAVAEPSPSIRNEALAAAASGASLVMAKKLAERIVASL